MFDILIKNGIIIDGTGNPSFNSDVGLIGDKIEIIDKIGDVPAKKIINAENKIVAPGFIDVHTISDVMLLAEPIHEAKLRQGITTEVLGNDGLSYAPLSPKNLLMMRQYLSGLYGNPDISWNWNTVKEFLENFNKKVSVNVAFLVPHSSLRLEVMGWGQNRATKNQIKSMQAIITKSIEEGAFGLSTGLSYPPNSYADTNELVELCKIVSKNGGIYVTHMRNYFEKIFEALEETISIGKKAEVSVMISHLKIGSKSHKGKAKKILEILEKARSKGVDISMNCYPYNSGSGPLTRLLPEWFAEDGPIELINKIKLKENRILLKNHFLKTDFDWQSCKIASVFDKKNKLYEGKTLEEIIKFSKKEPEDFICDLLLSENLGVSIVNYIDEDDLDDVNTIITHPLTMIGSDGLLIGQYPHPRTYGTFTRYLSKYVRELSLITWEEAIRKVTFEPANKFKLKNRGILKKGYFADITVFDAEEIKDKSTFENGRQFSVGIEHVIVNGNFAIDNSKITGLLPGRALASEF